jgi:uncharacterized protein with HEPN domain
VSRDPGLYLDDILESCARIERYTAGMTPDTFRADDRTVDAVLRNLAVIGEAAKRLPDDVRRAHPEVPWRRIAGLRDMLVHAYFGVDLDIVWDVVANRIPELRGQVALIVDNMS